MRNEPRPLFPPRTTIGTSARYSCARWAVGVTTTLLLSAGCVSAKEFTDPAHGYSVTYPDHWECDASPISVGSSGPILRNFPESKYVANGHPPKGGAEISVDTDPGPDPFGTMRKRLGHVIGHRDIKYTERQGSLRADFLEEVALDYVLHNVYLGMVRDGKGFLLYLSYNSGDAHGAAYEAVLDRIANTFRWQLTATPSEARPTRGTR
jgi:hypothetical protein